MAGKKKTVKQPPAESSPKPARRRRAPAKAAAVEVPPPNDTDLEHEGGRGGALVIVESPTKSRTLTKFLGRGFTVLASNGHIMDLPKAGLGVDLDNDFEPNYVPIDSKKKALAKIREAAKDADRIFLAPDPDREGEAIAWHLQENLKGLKRPLQRLTFNEITQRAVQQALEHPRDVAPITFPCGHRGEIGFAPGLPTQARRARFGSFSRYLHHRPACERRRTRARRRPSWTCGGGGRCCSPGSA